MPVIGTARPEVKYLYVRDPIRKERVLTIGRVKKDEGQLLAAYAVNKVTEPIVKFRNRPTANLYVHDHFSKHVGREVVNQRLLEPTKRFEIDLPKGDNVRIVPAVLQYFANADERNQSYKETNAWVDEHIARLQSKLKHRIVNDNESLKEIRELEANKHLLIPHIVRDICKRALAYPAASSLSNRPIEPEVYKAIVQVADLANNGA